MLEVTSIELENVITYKNATLELNKHPLIVVRGQNLDRKNEKSANAVGKSLLFSAIPNVRYAAPPLSVRKNSAKELFSADGKIRLHFKNGEHRYTIEQFAKGTSVGYKVLKDGTHLDFRKIDDTKRYIEKIFPVSEEQFYTTSYLSPRDFNVLLRGKPDQRFDFFEKIFELQVYDRLYVMVSRQYNDMKVHRQNLEFLRQEHETVQPKVLDTKPLKNRLARLESNMEKVQARILRYHERLSEISAYLSIAEGLDTETSVEKIEDDIAELIVREEVARRDYQKLVKQFEAYEAYSEIHAQIAEKEAEFNKLPVVLEKSAVIEADLKKWEAKGDTVNLAIERAEEIAESVAELNAQIAALNIPQAWIKKAGSYSADKLKNLLVRCRHDLRAKREEYEELSSLSGKKHCSTCQQPLTGKYLAQLLERYQTDITKLEKNENNYKLLQQYLAINEQIAEINEGAPDEPLEKLKIRADKIERELYRLKEMLHNKKAADKLADQIQDLRNALPKKVKKPEKQPDDVYAEIKKLHKQRTGLEEVVRQRVKLSQLPTQFKDVNQAKEQKAKYTGFIKRYAPKLQLAQKKYQNLSIAVNNSEQAGTQIVELSSRMKELEQKTEDFEIYEALREAYGAKGLRILQIKNLAEMYVERLNQFSNLIYPEPIKFSVNVDKSHFAIMAERNKKVSDVRRLSGSESTAFILLSLLALLPFVPAHLRLNTCIMDEIEVGLDNPSKQKFAEEFLPEINKVIPNIVLITPQDNKTFYLPNAVEYRVTKKNGVSTIRQV